MDFGFRISDLPPVLPVYHQGTKTTKKTHKGIPWCPWCLGGSRPISGTDTGADSDAGTKNAPLLGAFVGVF